MRVRIQHGQEPGERRTTDVLEPRLPLSLMSHNPKFILIKVSTGGVI
jgi:hypothetical protein